MSLFSLFETLEINQHRSYSSTDTQIMPGTLASSSDPIDDGDAVMDPWGNSSDPVDDGDSVMDDDGASQNPWVDTCSDIPVEECAASNLHTQSGPLSPGNSSTEVVLYNSSRPLTQLVQDQHTGFGSSASSNTPRPLTRPMPEQAEQPTKVLLKEVDYSSTLRGNVYYLRSRFHKTSADLVDVKSGKERLFQSATNQINALRLEHTAQINTLQAQWQNRHTKLAQDIDDAKIILADRDSVIARQEALIETLKKDTEQAEARMMRRAEVEASAFIEKMKAEKEAEVTLLTQKYEAVLRKNRELEQSRAGHEIKSPPPPPRPRYISTDTFSSPPHSPPPHFPSPSPSHRLRSFPTDSSHHRPSVTQQSGSARAQSIGVNEQCPSKISNTRAYVSDPVCAPSNSMPFDQAVIQKVTEEVCRALQGTSPRTPTPGKKASRKVLMVKHEIASDTERNQNLEHVRDLFKEAFGVSMDDEFLLIGGATREQVDVFSAGGSGPDTDNLKWDFSSPPSSAWNKVVIQYLLQRLKAMKEQEEWTTQPKSDVYWEDAISQKFRRIKTNISSAKPQIRGDCSVETDTEIASRLMRQREEKLRKSRISERRLNKYRRRLGITKTLAELKTDMNDEDADVWQFLFNLVGTLGSDGTSSDESDDEDIETVFNVRAMPWRRDIRKELDIIDVQRAQEKDIFSPKGAKVTKRIRSALAPTSSRRPVADLPECLYDSRWLSQHPGSASNKAFPWMHIVIQK